MAIDARTPARVKQLSPMSLMRDNALGVYISIPFCRSKCTYCNFASGVYPASEHQRYVERLIEDMVAAEKWAAQRDRKSTRLNSSHLGISYAVFCLKKKKEQHTNPDFFLIAVLYLQQAHKTSHL